MAHFGIASQHAEKAGHLQTTVSGTTTSLTLVQNDPGSIHGFRQKNSLLLS